MPRWAAILWLVVLGIWIGLSFASSRKWGSRPVRVLLCASRRGALIGPVVGGFGEGVRGLQKTIPEIVVWPFFQERMLGRLPVTAELGVLAILIIALLVVFVNHRSGTRFHHHEKPRSGGVRLLRNNRCFSVTKPGCPARWESLTVSRRPAGPCPRRSARAGRAGGGPRDRAPRTTRDAGMMPPDTPSTMMICGRPRPAIDMMVSSNSSPGNAIQASTKRVEGANPWHSHHPATNFAQGTFSAIGPFAFATALHAAPGPRHGRRGLGARRLLRRRARNAPDQVNHRGDRRLSGASDQGLRGFVQ